MQFLFPPPPPFNYFCLISQKRATRSMSKSIVKVAKFAKFGSQWPSKNAVAQLIDVLHTADYRDRCDGTMARAWNAVSITLHIINACQLSAVPAHPPCFVWVGSLSSACARVAFSWILQFPSTVQKTRNLGDLKCLHFPCDWACIDCNVYLHTILNDYSMNRQIKLVDSSIISITKWQP